MISMSINEKKKVIIKIQKFNVLPFLLTFIITKKKIEVIYIIYLPRDIPTSYIKKQVNLVPAVKPLSLLFKRALQHFKMPNKCIIYIK